MTHKTSHQINLSDTSEVEAVKNNNLSNVLPTSFEVKASYAQTILTKRKAALELAKKAYEDAVKKRESELGKLCLECGLGEYDLSFLKDHLLKLVASFPKSNPEKK